MFLFFLEFITHSISESLLLGFLLPMNYQEYLWSPQNLPNNTAFSYRDSRAYNRIATNPAVITNGYGKAFSWIFLSSASSGCVAVYNCTLGKNTLEPIVTVHHLKPQFTLKYTFSPHVIL
jgi:hypothetical protein